MATDPKQLKQEIEDLQDRLNDITASITKAAKEAAQEWGTALSKKFEAAANQLESFKDRTERLSKDLSKSKDISKEINKITNEINKANLKNNQISIAKAVAEEKYKNALISGTQAQKESARKGLEMVLTQLQLQESIENELKTLLKIAQAQKEQNNILDNTRKKLEGLASQYLSISAIFKFIVDAAFKADKQTTELAKSLGISKDQAKLLRDNTVVYAKASGDAFVTTEKLMEAQNDLTQQLGVAVNYTNKQREDFSRLTKLMGLSVEQAGKLAKLSIVNGTSIEATTKSIIRGSVASQQANRISIDQRTILKDVANLSEGILIKFQGNPEALGAAVVQAHKLGLTLEQVDKVGESLLNWESSIENELKAELITGKQINLEKARYAALTGDQATLMQELANQVGSLSDYQNMNVIAQKSLAEAFGLSRDEMSKMLLEQEKINKLGDVSQMTLDQQLEALRAQGEPLDSVLYKQIQQQSAQEKFNNAVEKLQDLLGNLVAGPLSIVIDGFANLVSNAGLLYTTMIAIGAISFARTIMGLSLMITQLAAAGAISATTASALTFGLGAAAIVAGAAMILGMMNSSTDEAVSNAQNVKDGVAPASKGPFTITDSFGATAITAKGDGLAVSPNISRGNNTPDNSGLEKLMGDIHNTLKDVMSRPSIAVVPTRTIQAMGATSDLGSAQMQNTYPYA